MITPAQRAEIRRLYFGEHWKIGTVAAALGVHHETVRAAVFRETGGGRRGVSRPSALDPFLPFIRDTLTQYPRLRATRLHEMLRQRGYPGSAVSVRRLVRRLRPPATTQVYRRIVTLPAEQAQVDWGTFGTVRIGRGVRAVSGFVMVLGYSRALFALFTLDKRWRAFCAATSPPSRPWAAAPGPSSTTTSGVPCWIGAAPRFSFTRACSSWVAFLRNHKDDIAAMDRFTVPSASRSTASSSSSTAGATSCTSTPRSIPRHPG